jgi:hypothetical protein
MKTAVAVAHPREHRLMIEPDNSGIPERGKERDLARPLFGKPLQQLAGRMLRPHDFRHQKSEGDREHAIAERLEPVGFR